MKKLLALLIAAGLTISLVACDDPTPTPADPTVPTVEGTPTDDCPTDCPTCDDTTPSVEPTPSEECPTECPTCEEEPTNDPPSSEGATNGDATPTPTDDED